MKIVREPLLAPPAGMNWRMIWSSEVAGCDKMDISGRKLQRGGRRAAQRGSRGRRPARRHMENLTIILGKSGYFARGGTLMRPAV